MKTLKSKMEVGDQERRQKLLLQFRQKIAAQSKLTVQRVFGTPASRFEVNEDSAAINALE